MEISEVTREKLEEILKTYIESIKKNKPIVFCVNCGSTRLDQNFVSQIQCYDCRATGIWNGQKFSIARDGEVQDVFNAIIPPEDPFYFTDWRSQMLASLEEFFQSVDSTMVTIAGGEETITEEEFQNLSEEWETLQNRIELFLRGIKTRPRIKS